MKADKRMQGKRMMGDDVDAVRRRDARPAQAGAEASGGHFGSQTRPVEAWHPEEARPNHALRARIAAFLAEHTTVTLATVGADGTPAAAAVFYAHDADLNLYFLSEERTQHGQNLLADPQVAGTIQADGQDWRGIRGLQLRGQATVVSGALLAHAAVVYGQKFVFVAALLAGQGPGVLAGPLARARFWVLRPTWLRLIDNTVRFGYKEELILTAGHNESE
ncbi:MAG: pyridoxamine 5'-phosphate oxidase family protein [Anaerolineae bacterium]